MKEVSYCEMKEGINKIIRKYITLDFSEESWLYAELAFDSFELIELVMDIEKMFKISIPNKEWASLLFNDKGHDVKLGAVYLFVAKHLGIKRQ